MRYSSVVLIGALSFCGGEGRGRSGGTGVRPTQTTSTQTPASPPPSQAAERQPAELPATGRVRTELGELTGRIEGASRVTAVRLQVVASAEAERETLRSTNRIVGYPMLGTPQEVSSADRETIARTLLDDASYDFTVERRCRNATLVGVRFEGASGSSVEVAIGMPCAQVLVARPAQSGAVGSWYGLMRQETADALVAIVDAALSRTAPR